MEYRVQDTEKIVPVGKEYRLNNKIGLSVKRSVSVTVCILSVLTVLFSGCRPRGILHSWEMRSVLVDLHKTDALLQVSGLHHGHDEAENIYYAMVLEQHGITQAQFDSSLVWYTAHPQLFDKIYPRVLKQLHAEREAFETAHADEMFVLLPESKEERIPTVAPRPLTHAQLDSMLWVTQHGYPTLWTPLVMHDTEDQLLP